MKHFGCFICLAILLAGLTAHADAPRVMSYQSKLTDPSGVPQPGTYKMTFRLWNAEEQGNTLLEDMHEAVEVDDDGLYYVEIWVPPENSFDIPMWLGVEVEDDGEMIPRHRLTSSPYAFFAMDADKLDGKDASEFVRGSGQEGYIARFVGENVVDKSVIYQSGPTVFVGNNLRVTGKACIGPDVTNTGVRAFAAGEKNTASGVWSAVGGGYDNYATGKYAGVGGGQGCRARGNWSVVCGGGGEIVIDSNSAIGDYSAIGGGHRNTARGMRATVGGGWRNTAGNTSATVAGGERNTAGLYAAVGGGMENSAGGWASTVAGGFQNVAGGGDATVAGGYANQALGSNSAVGGGVNCRAEGDYSVICGGGGTSSSLNRAVGDYSAIVGGRANTATGWGSVVGGGKGNTVGVDETRGCATVGGGEANAATHGHATVGGGQGNVASDSGATVGGGLENDANRFVATVGGGWRNSADGMYSVVSGGRANVAATWDCVVAGGKGNTAGVDQMRSCATVGGGEANTATGGHCTVAGGQNNSATDTLATVGGGCGNTARSEASVCGGVSNWAQDGATIGGGRSNSAYGRYAAIGGGRRNHCEGDYSAMPGGQGDSISGDYSMAFGYGVEIANSYRVVFFDGSNSGRLGISRDDNDGGIDHPIHVGTNSTNGNGAHLTAGGTWTNGSSREFKEAFEDIDGREVLDRLESLDVRRWQYKGTDEYHIGPVAEDFHDAFGTGTDDRYLASSDVAGVGLRAIQELIAVVETQQREIEDLKVEIENMKSGR